MTRRLARWLGVIFGVDAAIVLFLQPDDAYFKATVFGALSTLFLDRSAQ